MREETGGPRFWFAFARMVRKSKLSGSSAFALTIRGPFDGARPGTFSAHEPPWESTIPGYIGQWAAFNAGPDSDAPPDVDIEQWCLPARRQQAGRFDADAEPKTGPISEKLKIANN
jgi:hypothetical protein